VRKTLVELQEEIERRLNDLVQDCKIVIVLCRENKEGTATAYQAFGNTSHDERLEAMRNVLVCNLVSKVDALIELQTTNPTIN
jgi:hypothetical protein